MGVNNAIRNMWIYSIVFVIMLLLIAFLCVLFIKRDSKIGSKLLLIMVGCFLLVTIHLATTLIPFAYDYFNHNLVVQDGIYINKLGDKKKSFSARNGIYSIQFETEVETLNLTTAPWCKDNFPVGMYYATAYYFPKAETLLYIDLLDEYDAKSSTS